MSKSIFDMGKNLNREVIILEQLGIPMGSNSLIKFMGMFEDSMRQQSIGNVGDVNAEDIYIRSTPIPV